MSQTAVVFNQVSKKYENVQALDRVSFEIPRGSIFGYIGPNGAGKTTTIKILVGLIQKFEGEVLVDGQNIIKNRMSIYHKLGYLPQDVGFQEWRTVGQMLSTFGLLSGLDKSEIHTRIENVLETVDLLDVEQRKIAHLSGGMRQKLHLAQCLIHNPELLILDEPMSGLDPTSRHQVRTTIRTLSQSGVTILFSSHILSDVQDIATQVGILNNGKIMIVGSPEEIQSHFQIGNDIEIILAKACSIRQELEKMLEVDSINQILPTRLTLHLKPSINVDDSIKRILENLVANGCCLRSFRLAQPSLEEVYLKYVGGTEQ